MTGAEARPEGPSHLRRSRAALRNRLFSARFELRLQEIRQESREKFRKKFLIPPGYDLPLKRQVLDKVMYIATQTRLHGYGQWAARVLCLEPDPLFRWGLKRMIREWTVWGPAELKPDEPKAWPLDASCQTLAAWCAANRRLDLWGFVSWALRHIDQNPHFLGDVSARFLEIPPADAVGQPVTAVILLDTGQNSAIETLADGLEDLSRLQVVRKVLAGLARLSVVGEGGSLAETNPFIRDCLLLAQSYRAGALTTDELQEALLRQESAEIGRIEEWRRAALDLLPDLGGDRFHERWQRHGEPSPERPGALPPGTPDTARRVAARLGWFDLTCREAKGRFPILALEQPHDAPLRLKEPSRFIQYLMTLVVDGIGDSFAILDGLLPLSGRATREKARFVTWGIHSYLVGGTGVLSLAQCYAGCLEEGRTAG